MVSSIDNGNLALREGRWAFEIAEDSMLDLGTGRGEASHASSRSILKTGFERRLCTQDAGIDNSYPCPAGPQVDSGPNAESSRFHHADGV